MVLQHLRSRRLPMLRTLASWLAAPLLVASVLALLVLPVDAAPAPKKVNKDKLTNSIGMKLVRIPAGKFKMGSPTEEKGRSLNEGPQHEVEITRPFYMGIYEVTQEEYEKVMGKNPSHFAASGRGSA